MTIQPAYHGAIDVEEIRRCGFEADEIIDFSVNSNPFGPLEKVVECVAQTNIARYPDRECIDLISAISDQLSASRDRILIGNGSAEVLWLITHTLLKDVASVVIYGPTFGEYFRNCQMCNANIKQRVALTEEDFNFDWDTELAYLKNTKPDIVFLCNPNNPTGTVIPKNDLHRWVDDLPETLFVIDEAYAQFQDSFESAINLSCDNVIVLRSMTKDYSLAGLRLGFSIADVKLTQRLRANRIPWSVNSMAQSAGITALQHQSEYQKQWSLLNFEARQFKKSLSELGYKVFDSPMHYFLLEADDATSLRTYLLCKGLLVRDCQSYALPHCLRISTQLPEQNVRLLEALAQYTT